MGRGIWPAGRDNGRSVAGCRGPATAPQARPFLTPGGCGVERDGA
jgi:hypothetical protein